MSGICKRGPLFLLFFFLIQYPLFAAGWEHLGTVDSVATLRDGVELTAGSAKVRVTLFRDGIVRVRVAPHGEFAKDFSWAIIETPEVSSVHIEDAKDTVRMSAGEVVVLIQKSPLLISFADRNGTVILQDEPSLPMAVDGDRVSVWKKMPAEESYFGLGDKAGAMNRRSRAFTLWNTDSYAWVESSDPLYKSIPFFLGVNHGVAYGIFFDNTYRTNFDFGVASPDIYSFGSEGGEINYYYIAGPEPKRVVQSFAAMTGLTPLPPLWSLGFQQSRYSYFPQARAYEIVKTFRAKKVPADAIYFDIDFQKGNAPFTINREYFPDFEKMVSDFLQQGFKTVLITDLHIKSDPNAGYAPYDTGMKEDVFIKNPDGTVYVGPVWPGNSVFPDFTWKLARDWWGRQYKEFVGMGVAGFWNDMNEPAIFVPSKTMPLDTRHRLDDGSTIKHAAAHNILGLENIHATHDGLLKLRPNERPFVLTRAAYPGAQRYAATWTGDNSSTWNHLKMSTPIMLNLGLSAYPFVGSDIGGFVGSPTPDLLTRWIEVGAFNPIYRDHTGKGTADQEPWAHGSEQEAVRKRYIELRYRLLPYTYTAMEETSRTGLPLMRPVFLEFPQWAPSYTNERDFFFGGDFLVSPVTTEMLDAHEVQLPPGEWYDYWTATKLTDKDKLSLRPKLDEMPLYVRAGAIIPQQAVIQHTGETPAGPLELRVYPGKDCRGALYQDDGHTFNYQKGELLRVNYSCALSADNLTITSKIETRGFTPWWNSTDVTAYGINSKPKVVQLDHSEAKDWRYDAAAKAVTVPVSNAVRDWTIRIDF